MTTAVQPPTHRVSRTVAAIHDLLDQVGDASTWSMPVEEAGVTLRELTRLTARVTELELRVAAHAETIGVGDADGATSTASWWAHTTRLTRTETHRMTRLGVALADHQLVRKALACGDLVADQAQVIVRALQALPAGLDPAVVERAEAVLVAESAHLDAKALRILCRRILDIVAPEVGEAHEARLLAKEEADAAGSCRLTMTDDGHGRVHGRFTLPVVQAAMLKKALLAIAAPKHQTAVGTQPTGVRRPGPERMGRALCEYVERYPAHALPRPAAWPRPWWSPWTWTPSPTACAPPASAPARPSPPSQARRLACEAGIIPAVLNGPSTVLDLGRKRRFHTEPMRLALALRDGGCTAAGCDWPPGLCHAHHDRPWAAGGHTNLDNGRLLCPRHHTRAHDPTYTTTHHPGGKIAFTRRT